MLGGALEARRGRGEHTAKGARRLRRQKDGAAALALRCAAKVPVPVARSLSHARRARSLCQRSDNQIQETPVPIICFCTER